MPCNCTMGTGSPEGVVSGAVGDLYTQTDGSNGKTLWRKRFASLGPPTDPKKGWGLIQGDLQVNNVKDFGARGDGVTNDRVAIQAALTAAASNKGDVIFPPGFYCYDVSPNFAVADVRILGIGRVLLKHTGSGSAVLFDGNPNTAYHCVFENFSILGNDASENGLLVDNVSHSRFEDIRIYNATSVGLRIKWGVCDYFHNISVTETGGSWLPSPGFKLPNTGVFITKAPGGQQTTDCIFSNLILEYILGRPEVPDDMTKGAAVYLDSGFSNLFLAGTYEYCKRGVVIGPSSIGDPSGNNTVRSVYFEGNQGEDVLILGDAPRNRFYDLHCLSSASPAAVFHVSAGRQTVIEGGEYTNITLDAGAVDTQLSNLTCNLIDNGSIRTRQRSVFDFVTSPPVPGYAPVEDVVAAGLHLKDTPVLVLDESLANPSSPTTSNQAKVYVKGDKFIIQWKDGATTRWKYLLLSGAGVTWQHTTTAP